MGALNSLLLKFFRRVSGEYSAEPGVASESATNETPPSREVNAVLDQVESKSLLEGPMTSQEWIKMLEGLEPGDEVFSLWPPLSAPQASDSNHEPSRGSLISAKKAPQDGSTVKEAPQEESTSSRIMRFSV